MKQFAALFSALDSSTRTNDKIAALVDYFRAAESEDAAWAVWFLTGNRPRQAVPAKKLHQWAADAANMPLWLFEESYDAVGDLAETIALILPPPETENSLPLRQWIDQRLLPLRKLEEEAQREVLMSYWRELDRGERFVFNKLITGGFRVGVSALLVQRALSQVSGIDAKVIAHRMTGDWVPTVENYTALLSPETGSFDVSKPYPFFLAHPIAGEPDSLGPVSEWQAEWKWDGIRGQLIKRDGQVFLWSRGEELISEQFPEIIAAAAPLPDCVLDGEVLPAKDGKVLSFNALQKRLGRKNPGKKVLADTPAIFVAYDLLEVAGEDWRTRPLYQRREKLHELLYSIPHRDHADVVLQLSDIVRAPSWATLALARAQSRERGTEGLMLKRRESAYGVGRAAGKSGGDWWKWKIDPYTLDCVLMYAQRGHGKRASLYTDYTFGVWNREADSENTTNSSTGAPSEAKMGQEPRQLVTFAKAYSGLSDEEIAEVDAFIRKNTLEKFGPVRTVKPEMVFELAFEGIQRSNRHKSGVAVRFPRMARIRRDKKIEEADSLTTVLRMLDNGAT